MLDALPDATLVASYDTGIWYTYSNRGIHRAQYTGTHFADLRRMTG